MQSVVVGGGCACNAILMAALRQHLAVAGIGLLEARQAPPNDGGLALGQAWVARRMELAGHLASGENQPGVLLEKEVS
jgi:hydrogenase maturation protein HypF